MWLTPFPMRREQAEAINRTRAYFRSIWKEDMNAVPRVPLEREDAFRQDVHRLPASEDLTPSECWC
jgi:hypothetical protein